MAEPRDDWITKAIRCNGPKLSIVILAPRRGAPRRAARRGRARDVDAAELLGLGRAVPPTGWPRRRRAPEDRRGAEVAEHVKRVVDELHERPVEEEPEDDHPGHRNRARRHVSARRRWRGGAQAERPQKNLF